MVGKQRQEVNKGTCTGVGGAIDVLYLLQGIHWRNGINYTPWLQNLQHLLNL